MIIWLQGKKTYFLVAFGVLALLVQFLSGDISLLQFLNSQQFIELLALLGIGTLKAGFSRETKKVA